MRAFGTRLLDIKDAGRCAREGFAACGILLQYADIVCAVACEGAATVIDLAKGGALVTANSAQGRILQSTGVVAAGQVGVP